MYHTSENKPDLDATRVKLNWRISQFYLMSLQKKRSREVIYIKSTPSQNRKHHHYCLSRLLENNHWNWKPWTAISYHLQCLPTFGKLHPIPRVEKLPGMEVKITLNCCCCFQTYLLLPWFHYTSVCIQKYTCVKLVSQDERVIYLMIRWRCSLVHSKRDITTLVAMWNCFWRLTWLNIFPKTWLMAMQSNCSLEDAVPIYMVQWVLILLIFVQWFG